MPAFAPADASTLPLFLTDEDGAEAFTASRPTAQQGWLKVAGFTGGLGQLVLLAGPGGEIEAAVFGRGTAKARLRGRFHL
ncbi:MAG: leucyl aminopeptidase family protein, partial [Rhodobacteraceae bacterium]|nr:leucyl aminopeptidase family protein [Paracoccaceae bacterium]